MKQIQERKIINWIINSLEITERENFISTMEFYKDYCATYDLEFDKKNLLSFSLTLARCLKKLNMYAIKERKYDQRGYKNLQFKHNINVFETLTASQKEEDAIKIEILTISQSLRDIDKSFTKQTKILEQILELLKKTN